MRCLSIAVLVCLAGCATAPAIAEAAIADFGTLLPVYVVLAAVVLLAVLMLCFAWSLRNRLDRALARVPADAAAYPAFLAGYTELPLGLPRGTVRAILALIIVFGSVVFLAISMAQPASGTIYKFPEALTGILGAILGFYFGKGSTGDDGQGVAIALAPKAAPAAPVPAEADRP